MLHCHHYNDPWIFLDSFFLFFYRKTGTPDCIWLAGARNQRLSEGILLFDELCWRRFRHPSTNHSRTCKGQKNDPITCTSPTGYDHLIPPPTPNRLFCGVGGWAVRGGILIHLKASQIQGQKKRQTETETTCQRYGLITNPLWTLTKCPTTERKTGGLRGVALDAGLPPYAYTNTNTNTMIKVINIFNKLQRSEATARLCSQGLTPFPRH